MMHSPDSGVSYSRTNLSAPYFSQLQPGGPVIIAGHSKGGATSLIAAAKMGALYHAVISIAPGVYGAAQTTELMHAAPMVRAPTLLLLGDQDCCNEVHVQTLPIYNNLTSVAHKAVVVLGGANHCQWSTPTKGAAHSG